MSVPSFLLLLVVAFGKSDPMLQVHIVNGDAGSQEMLLLLERDRQKDTTELRQQAIYRSEVESLIGGGDNVFRFEWVRCLALHCVSRVSDLLRRPDPSISVVDHPAVGV